MHSLTPDSRHVKPAAVDLPSPARSDTSVRYDAAYLNELKASTPSTRPSLQDGDLSYDADMSMVEDSQPQSHMSSVIDLSVMFKPSKRTCYL